MSNKIILTNNGGISVKPANSANKFVIKNLSVVNIATGDGLTGGPIAHAGVISVNANTGLVANSSGLFVDIPEVQTTNASLLTSGTLDSNRLSNTGVTANTYGNSTHISTFTVDNKGRITAANSELVSITISQISDASTDGKAFLAANTSSQKTALGLLNSSVAGRLARFTDTLGTIGSTTGLFENDSGSVGIGTTSPQSKLDVKGAAGGNAILVQNSLGNYTYNLGMDGSNHARFDMNNSAGTLIHRLYTDNANASYIGGRGLGIGTTGALSKLDVNGSVAIGTYAGTTAAPTNGLIVSGNVGIGTTSPDEKLEIGGAGDVSTDRKALKFGEGGWSAPSASNALSDGDKLLLYYGGGYKTALGMGTLNEIWFASTNNTATNKGFSFYTGAPNATPTEKLTILNNGNVGIGTTSPSCLLDVGNGVINTTTLKTSGRVSAQEYTSEWDAYFSPLSGRSMFFRASTSGAVRMCIDPSGNVGIGTTNPGAKLEVISGSDTFPGSFSDNLKITAASYPSIWFRRTSASSGFLCGCDTNGFNILPETDGTAGSIIATFKSSGNVGIGTTSPGSKLTVVSSDTGSLRLENTQTSGSSAGAGSVYYSNDGAALASGDRLGFSLFGGYDGATMRNGGGVSGFAEGTWSSGVFPTYLTFDTTESGTRSEKMRITGAGRVGIGRTNPGAPLDILSNSSQDAIYVRDNAGTLVGDWGASSAGNGRFRIGNVVQLAASGHTYVNVAAFNFGIGTNAPLSKLGVNGSVAIGSYAATAAAPTNGLIVSGDVGIGTSSPGTKLEVYGSNAAGMTKVATLRSGQNQDGDGAAIYLRNNDTDTGLVIAGGRIATGQGGGTFFTRSSGVETATMTLRDGNVGIGTTSPGSRLHISGDANTQLTISATVGANLGLQGTNFGQIVNATGPLLITNNASGQPIYFRTDAGTEHMRIASGGNVGIGTTSPNSKLHVYTTAETSGSASTVTGTSQFQIQSSSTNKINMGLYSDAPYAGFIQVGGSGGGSVYPLLLNPAGSNVGIGTTAPLSKLDVNGSVAIGTYAATTAAPTNGLIVSGNVGIGTSSISSGTKLDVSGPINISAGSSYRVGGTDLYFANIANSLLALGSASAIGRFTGAGSGTFYNIAIGATTMLGLTTGNSNVAVGVSALQSLTEGANNLGLGYVALSDCTTGYQNVAVGSQALWKNITGFDNVAIGTAALRPATLPRYTIAIGTAAFVGNYTAFTMDGGTAIGYQAGFNVATGANYNTLIGHKAGYDITTGARNIVIGSVETTGSNITTGSRNILIGLGVRSGLSSTGNDQLNIGNLIFGTDISSGNTLSTGKIGIGVASPTAMLDINSNKIRVRTAKTPSSATDTGDQGDVCWDDSYIYVCTATNTWKRATLASW